MAISDIERKKSRTFKFVFTNDDGTVKDITGWKIHFTAKVKIIDADLAALISVNSVAGSVADDLPLQGLMFVKLTTTNTDIPEQTLSYSFDVEIPGPPIEVEVLEQGTLKILKSNLISI